MKISRVLKWSMLGIALFLALGMGLQSRSVRAAGHIVEIDPSHQGPEVDLTDPEPIGPGATQISEKSSAGSKGVADGLQEHELNLNVALYLRDILVQRGYTVYLTRDTSYCLLSNSERARKATSDGAEILISLHTNSRGSGDAEGTRGAEALCMSASNPYSGNLHGDSALLGECLLNAYCSATGFANLGVKDRDIYSVLNYTSVPTSLFEMGYMDNSADNLYLSDSTHQALIAYGIANGIDAYFAVKDIAGGNTAVTPSFPENADAQTEGNAVVPAQVPARTVSEEEADGQAQGQDGSPENPTQEPLAETEGPSMQEQETALQDQQENSAEGSSDQEASENTADGTSAQEQTEAGEEEAYSSAEEQAETGEEEVDSSAEENAEADAGEEDASVEEELETDTEDGFTQEQVADTEDLQDQSEENDENLQAPTEEGPEDTMENQGTLSPSAGGETAEQEDESNAQDRFLDIVSQALGTLPVGNGNWSIYVRDIKGNVAGSAHSASMQAASLIKLFIMGAVYEDYDALAQQYGAENLDNYLYTMITVSDNDSANALVNILGHGDNQAGMEAVNTYCADHGYADTSMGRLLLASKEFGDNYTSVRDCGEFLTAVYRSVYGEEETTEGENLWEAAGSAGSESVPHAADMFALLQAQTRRNKIPANMPEGVQVANKTGELTDVENDAAIIYDTPNGNDLIIVLMSENLNAVGEAQSAIAQVSRMIYDFYH